VYPHFFLRRQHVDVNLSGRDRGAGVAVRQSVFKGSLACRVRGHRDGKVDKGARAGERRRVCRALKSGTLRVEHADIHSQRAHAEQDRQA
jgi:hypothetical protein